MHQMNESTRVARPQRSSRAIQGARTARSPLRRGSPGLALDLTGLLLRAALVVVLGLGLWAAPVAKAEPAVENLMVPSGAMGRDIPVAFLGSGPHAVYLLDAFNAGDTVSNWVTAGNAMNTLAGKGISVVAPAGGAYSLYTNWEQDGSKQ